MMQPEDHGLIYVGNWEKHIVDHFNYCVDQPADWAKSYSSTLGDLLDSAVQDINKQLNTNMKSRISCIYQERQSAAFQEWHPDGPRGSFGMIISSWPWQTQVLLGARWPKGRRKFLGIELCYHVGNRDITQVEQLVKAEAFQVFTPKDGDVWYLPPGTFHRTHPFSIGKPRAMVRSWMFESDQSTTYTHSVESFVGSSSYTMIPE